MKRLTLALCLCAVTASPLWASDWSQFAKTAPADTDLLIVIEQAAVLRAEPAGKSLAELFSQLIPMTATMQAWNSLAAHLDLPSDEAFDVLLGNRVVFIGRHQEDAPMQWAIESEIPSKLAFRLLRKLGARPRDIKNNHAIALLEENRFQLTYRRFGDCATMIFAPTSSESLFNDLIAKMTPAAGKSLADTSEFSAAIANSRSEAAIFSYVRNRKTHVSWLAATATIERAGVSIEFAASAEKKTAPEQTPVSAAQWKYFSQGSLLAFVDRLSFDDLTLPWIVSRFGFGDLLKHLKTSSGRRIALGVFEPEPGQLTAAAAIETDDLDRLAPLGDAVVAQFASTMQSMNQNNAEEAEGESFNLLEGSFPQATRSVGLAHSAADAHPDNNEQSASPTRLFWSYPTSPGQTSNHGWWVIANSNDLHDRTIKTLIQPSPMPAKREPGKAVSYLLAKPTDFLKALVASDLLPDEGIPPQILALERIRLVEGRSYLKGDLLHGRLNIKLGPAPNDR
jgi:hypothetical protein